MDEILFVAHRIPFPPDRGDKIRSHHFLKALARLAPVHVATLGETDADFAAEPMLANLAASHLLARRPASLAAAGIKALASGKPVSLTAFESAPLRQWIEHTLMTRPVSTIFVFSGQMGQYVPASFAGRLVIDLCDVDSAKFEEYAAAGKGPRGWIDAREAGLLAAEERRLAARADTTLLISEAEAALLRSRIDERTGTVRAIGNGIDTAIFDPLATVPHPALLAEPGPHVLFTGQMDYQPNVAAVRRAATAIMPAIRAAHPEAQFHIVGRAPAGEVRALEGHNGTRVWGEVPDVKPFLAAADLVLAPLTVARGVQNKVLEAMAMARPVVLTSVAATGIGATHGEHLLISDSDAELISHALELIAEPAEGQRMGSAARRVVVQHKSWEGALAPLAGILGLAPGGARDAA